MAFEKDPNEIGALWSRRGAKGEFLSGHVEIDGQKVDIVCFAVNGKSDKSPAWRVMKSKPRQLEPGF